MLARDRHQLRRQQTPAERAAEMRAVPTRSEAALWAMLRARKLGASVRRQVVIGQHVVDFLVPARKLVVEVDGGCHRDRRVADARREPATLTAPEPKSPVPDRRRCARCATHRAPGAPSTKTATSRRGPRG